MNALDLLKNLRQAGIILWAAEGRVNFHPSPSADLLREMRAHKPDLLRHLEQEGAAGTVEQFDQAKICDLVRRAGYLAENCGALRRELHRLFDLADAADRAGDVSGANRALSAIGRLLAGVEGAKTSASGARGGVSVGAPVQGDLYGDSMQPRGSNAAGEVSAVSGKVSGLGARETITEIRQAGGWIDGA